MGIEEFDPISRPKILQSAAKLRKLSDDKIIVINAEDNNKVLDKEDTMRD